MSKILIVEDELVIALELQVLLEDEGYTVVGPVNSVEKALALIEEAKPDAAVVDINLGDERSTPVTAALAAEHIPFIVTSGYDAAMSGESTVFRAPWLNKPIRYDRLLGYLTKMLQPPA